ncbi:MAG: 4Fe-4S dicluster protein [Firmicutes bacterium]|nr:4Fe-4S dicluster protein [Bacillota bacterium]
MQKVNITINDMKVEAKAGQTVLQAALDADIYIPHLCAHPDLTPQGGCKLCVVEINGVESAVTSCTTEVEEGMVIRTKTDNLSRIRGVALELMLASHPGDCTSCPVYLNCELQAMMQYLGVAHSRLRRIEKKNIRINSKNPLIVREMERCIQCGRCIRVCSDIREVGILKYNQKDGEIYVGTENDLPFREADCRFCGACIEICPTGALRDVEGTFSKDSPREIALTPCRDTCPAGTDIPKYVRLVGEGKYSEAVGIIREKLPFPLSLGYVCNHTCETACKRSKLNSPVGIRSLKRFAVENDLDGIWKDKAMKKQAPTGKKVAVIGAGPAGLTSALYLAKKGHAVTVYEKLPVVGGMMTVGIPEYRLPREVVKAEVAFIENMGVEIVTDKKIDSALELKNSGYDAVLIAVGTHKGRKLSMNLSDQKQVYTALEFLASTSLKKEITLGNKIAIIGGGNVAFDCARTAVRLGIKNITVICLEPKDAMLADEEEVIQAQEEGVIIKNSKSTIGLEGSESGITGVKHIDVNNFSFGPDGQLQLDAVEGSESITEADTVIFAAGQMPDLDENFGVELNRGNRVAVNPETLETDKTGIFAAGDAIYGTKVVIEAVASGRKAASEIDKYLGGDGNISEELVSRSVMDKKLGKIAGFSEQKREETEVLEAQSRKCSFSKVDLGLDENKACREAGRCLQCDLRIDLRKVKFWADYKYK